MNDMIELDELDGIYFILLFLFLPTPSLTAEGIVFLGKSLVPEELGIYALHRRISCPARLLNTIGKRLVVLVVVSCVF